MCSLVEFTIYVANTSRSKCLLHNTPWTLAKYDPYLPILGVNVDLINSLHDRDNAIVFSLCNVQ